MLVNIGELRISIIWNAFNEFGLKFATEYPIEEEVVPFARNVRVWFDEIERSVRVLIRAAARCTDALIQTLFYMNGCRCLSIQRLLQAVP
jgi:hypothetical protein